MAAIVKPIEAKAVHLIQSGQVIVDLCSVVKELVENSLDAGANVIEVRFKNNGLDEIEVQDNGSGISATNYESVALKHYTSKLATYDDLQSLSTFGFRGEALSSLCALSTFTITTAQADEAPKGHRLVFEPSGKLKSRSLVACQKGTTTTVSNLFENLPVRRKELAKNIKREYAKVLGILHAYACISINVKFTVKNVMPKGKSMVVFATKSNPTTRENIANVYGAKTLPALASLELELSMEQSSSQLFHTIRSSAAVAVRGHISKPVFGEGRQTPDRQMFFVNGRPCGLPQIAKAINEVYKSFNVSQSPFIFADFRMDTNAYDVNVSPDKRSIFLHNAAALIESLKTELTAMFDDHDQTMPQTQLLTPKLPAFRQLTVIQPVSGVLEKDLKKPADSTSADSSDDDIQRLSIPSPEASDDSGRLLHAHFDGFASTREAASKHGRAASRRIDTRQTKAQIFENEQLLGSSRIPSDKSDGEEADQHGNSSPVVHGLDAPGNHGHDLYQSTGASKAEPLPKQSKPTIFQRTTNNQNEPEIATVRQLPRQTNGGIVQNALDHMRPRRTQPEMATITIGDKTITKIIGSSSQDAGDAYIPPDRELQYPDKLEPGSAVKAFTRQLGQFSAPGTQLRTELERIEQPDADEASLVGSEDTEDVLDDHQTQSVTVIDQESRHARIQDVSAIKNNAQADPDYVDEEEVKAQEDARVAILIQAAEESASQRSTKESSRVLNAFKGGRSKDATTRFEVIVDGSLVEIRQQAMALLASHSDRDAASQQAGDAEMESEETAEEKLSLTVSKTDFANMLIVGQFNLGFILAVRPQKTGSPERPIKSSRDELFIIDQHASDEKYNFERLQAETIVGNQRLVRPVTLDLTAVEEEILIDGGVVLEKNGFIVDIDVSGDKPVGQRCQLVSLPLSREVVFNTRDLDELIHLLSESPMISDLKSAPRPSKVRKMFAMRACRSSIMIGKTLSRRQMQNVVQHMGMIDKPWNCPHGRPTMRHLASLDDLGASLWQEGDGLRDTDKVGISVRATESGCPATGQVWKNYIK